MTIGLFLDVDNTLTDGFIQQKFAELLNVDKDYDIIESQYQKEEINSDEFGNRLIELFNRTQFNEDFAKENFSRIPLKNSAEPLLKSRSPSVLIYFVSAGPSYYVQRLAEKYKVPPDNVLCSEYSFDSAGRLSSCNAVSPGQKHDFMKQHAKTLDLTIGVGDDEIHDASFLHGCDIGLLVPKRGYPRIGSDNHLFAQRLSLVQTLVVKLDRTLRGLAVRSV